MSLAQLQDIVMEHLLVNCELGWLRDCFCGPDGPARLDQLAQHGVPVERLRLLVRLACCNPGGASPSPGGGLGPIGPVTPTTPQLPQGTSNNCVQDAYDYLCSPEGRALLEMVGIAVAGAQAIGNPEVTPYLPMITSFITWANQACASPPQALQMMTKVCEAWRTLQPALGNLALLDKVVTGVLGPAVGTLNVSMLKTLLDKCCKGAPAPETPRLPSAPTSPSLPTPELTLAPNTDAQQRAMVFRALTASGVNPGAAYSVASNPVLRAQAMAGVGEFRNRFGYKRM